MTGMDGMRHIRVRTWAAAAVVAAVGLTAACGAENKGTSGSVMVPRSGQGIGAGGVPSGTPFKPTLCGPEATAAAVNPLPGPNDQVAPGGTLDKIRKRGFLIAGIDLNTELFGYDPQHDNNPQGFDVDIARAMARAIFGSDGHIQFRVVTLGDPKTGEYAQLHAGNVDLVVQTTTITCARMQSPTPLSFSNPYYTAELKLLMPLGDDGKPQSASLAGLKGVKTADGSQVKVCATLNSTSAAEILRVLGKAGTFTAANALDCLADLQQGLVGAIYTDDALLRGMESQDPHVKMTTAPAEEEQPYGIVTNHPASGTNDLTPFVNTALANLIQDTGPNGWRSLFANDLGSQPKSLPQIPQHYPLGS
ncbi:polar amino acid transport system substrate-binding protein [Catenulispora sp. GAS73]|uniref:glutamate ABC transporter substrate-binding protein n=1 Tax=Catenulispora sp. GAS73 TaxID=3156269 RepID=UPI003519BABB